MARPEQTDGAARSRAPASRSPATGSARAVDLAAASHTGLAARRANRRVMKSSAAHIIIKASVPGGGQGEEGRGQGKGKGKKGVVLRR